MAKFRIHASSISYVYVDVEAENEERAREMYDLIDGEDFETTPYGGFVLDEIMPLDDNAEVKFKASEWLEDEEE